MTFRKPKKKKQMAPAAFKTLDLCNVFCNNLGYKSADFFLYDDLRMADLWAE